MNKFLVCIALTIMATTANAATIDKDTRYCKSEQALNDWGFYGSMYGMTGVNGLGKLDGVQCFLTSRKHKIVKQMSRHYIRLDDGRNVWVMGGVIKL